jgi:hypothetical protein
MEVNPGIKRTATICILQCGEQFLLLKRFKEAQSSSKAGIWVIS